MDPVRFTFSRRQESRRSQQVTPVSEEKEREGEREREREREREGGREGDNKTTAANSYRFEILRNKVYTRRAVLDIMVLASPATSSSLIVALCEQGESIIVYTYVNFYYYFLECLVILCKRTIYHTFRIRIEIVVFAIIYCTKHSFSFLTYLIEVFFYYKRLIVKNFAVDIYTEKKWFLVGLNSNPGGK